MRGLASQEQTVSQPPSRSVHPTLVIQKGPCLDHCIECDVMARMHPSARQGMQEATVNRGGFLPAGQSSSKRERMHARLGPTFLCLEIA